MCMLQDDVPPCQNPYIVNAHVLEAEKYSGITTDGWFEGWFTQPDEKLRKEYEEQRKRKEVAKTKKLLKILLLTMNLHLLL